jgi:hypothetical protein
VHRDCSRCVCLEATTVKDFSWVAASCERRLVASAPPRHAPGAHHLTRCALRQQDDPCTSAKLKAAAGLSLLDQRKYRQAARAFVEVSPELAYTYNEVGLPACACACFGSMQLCYRVLCKHVALT